jgi:hypothetical protein
MSITTSTVNAAATIMKSMSITTIMAKTAPADAMIIIMAITPTRCLQALA